MAVWLVRVLDETGPTAVEASRFADVDNHRWWMPYVERLADLGIHQRLRHPTGQVLPHRARYTRADGVVLDPRVPASQEPSNQFTDTVGNTHETDINALATAGITIGCATEPALYCPSQDTTRAQRPPFSPEPLTATRLRRRKAVSP